MRTALFTFALLIGLSFSSTSVAQKFEDIYSKYQSTEGIQAMKFNDVASMAGAALQGQDPEIQELAKNTSSVCVLVSKQFLENLDRDVKGYVKKKKMEDLVSYSGDGNNIGIFIIEKKEVIQEIVVSVKTGTDHVVVQVIGSYPLKTIQELISKNADKFNIKF